MEKFYCFVNRLFLQMYDTLNKLKQHRKNVRIFILVLGESI